MKKYETWTGADGEVAGRVRTDAKGRKVYVIRRRRAGRRYEVATGKHTLDEARVELAVFLLNPEGYARRNEPPPQASEEPIFLTTELGKEFLAWSRDVKGNSPAWVHTQKLFADWWQTKLSGVDLRRVSYQDHVKPALADVKSYRCRAATILALYRWLRLEKNLPLADDPVHGRFYMPDPQAEQMRRNKAVPFEHFQKVLGHLVGAHRDLLLLQGDTGMHVSEAWRFAKHGATEPLPRNAQEDGSAGVVVIPWHKSSAREKEPLRVRVNAMALAAAERILEHGPFDGRRYCKAVKAACGAAGLADDAVFGPGQMRHSVATHSVNGGEDIGAVSSALGHRSRKTTRKFYLTFASPKKIRTLADALSERPAKRKGRARSHSQ